MHILHGHRNISTNENSATTSEPVLSRTTTAEATNQPENPPQELDENTPLIARSQETAASCKLKY